MTTIFEDDLGAGEARVAVDVSALAPGPYVVRLEAPDIQVAAAARLLMVVR